MSLRQTIAVLCVLLAVLSLVTAAADIALLVPFWFVAGLIVAAAVWRRPESSLYCPSPVRAVPSLRGPPLVF